MMTRNGTSSEGGHRAFAVVSQADLFPRCLEVLREARMPLDYTELTRRGLMRMGYPGERNVVNANKEDVREKFLGRRWHGLTFYVGDPWCLGALSEWFEPQLLHLDEYIRIPGHAQAGANGAAEALLRAPYFEHKHANADTQRLHRARASGLVLQQHVAEWFAQEYPQCYRPPSNQGQWDRWAPEDFGLAVGTRVLNIDVVGPNKWGQYKPEKNKPKTDLHLCCRIVGQDCLFEEVVRGKHFTGIITPGHNISPVRFLVWLNCHREQIDYSMIAKYATGEGCHLWTS